MHIAAVPKLVRDSIEALTVVVCISNCVQNFLLDHYHLPRAFSNDFRNDSSAVIRCA